jgi:TolB protein
MLAGGSMRRSMGPKRATDDKTAVLRRSWESEENGKREEAHRHFRYSADGWLVDGYLLDLKSGKATNVTGALRVSHFNEGLRFMPATRTSSRPTARA